MEDNISIVRKDTNYIQQLNFMTHANFFTRFFSYLIDIIVLWAVAQLTIVPILTMLGMRDVFFLMPALSIENIATALIYFIYFTLMTYYFKQTLGKMIFDISVISAEGNRLKFGQVFYRETIGRIISNFLFYLPYLAVLFTDAKIGLHDFIGDTYVVSNKYKEYSAAIQSEMTGDNVTELEKTEEVNHQEERNF